MDKKYFKKFMKSMENNTKTGPGPARRPPPDRARELFVYCQLQKQPQERAEIGPFAPVRLNINVLIRKHRGRLIRGRTARKKQK